VSRFQNSKALQKVRLKGELKPILSLAVQVYLKNKTQTFSDPDKTSHPTPNIEKPIAALLASWNGYEQIDPSRLIVTGGDSGRIELSCGLIAEASPYAAENYTVWAKQRQPSTEKDNSGDHPPFVEEDFSWYRALETRIDDSLDRWEERARKRREQRRENVKLQLQRLLDTIQAPLSIAFDQVTAQVGPVVDRLRSMFRSNLLEVVKKESPPPASLVDNDDDAKEPNKLMEDLSNEELIAALKRDTSEPKISLPSTKQNLSEPEDLVILTNSGNVFMILTNVSPSDRLLALPLTDSLTKGSTKQKMKPPYRLRLARGGLVIIISFVALGAAAPAYRSLRFILEYPRTAEIVMITLVGSVAYNMWSWLNNMKTQQRHMIAVAVQSRLVARNNAAIDHLIIGAVKSLTHAVMEDYVSRLLYSDEEDYVISEVDPFVTELGLSLGLLKREYPHGEHYGLTSVQDDENELAEADGIIVAVSWETARSELVHRLARRV